MKLFNKGNYKILLPVIVLAILLFVILVWGVGEAGFHGFLTLDNTTNGTWTTDSSYMFNCTARTNGSDLVASGINLSLYFGPASAGQPAFNTSNKTGVANNTQFNFTVSNIAEGFYYWTCSASSLNASGLISNVTFNGTNYTITFDRTTPQLVRLNSPTAFISPDNGLNTSLSQFEFNFSAVDNLAVNITCNISMDGVKNNASKTVLNGTLNSNIVNISGLANGSHSWNVTCYDPANTTGNTTSTRSFTVDTAKPSDITLNSINNNLNTSLTEIEFNFSATDNVDTNLSCNITVDTVVNVTYKSVRSGSTNSATVNVTNFAQGNHFWNVTCYDEANNSNTSQTRLFTVDRTVPQLVRLNSPTAFISPDNGLNTSLSQFEFNFSAVDNLAENITCNISMDGVRNNASKTVLNGTTNSNIVNISGLANGSHSWNVTCYDPANTTGNTTATRSFTVDTAKPSDITLNSGNLNTTSTTVQLNFSATDNVDTNLSCNITVNNVVNVTYKSVLSGSANSATVSINNLANGNYFWNVTCYDEANNSNTSETRLFSVDSTPPVITGISPNSISVPTNYTGLPIKFNVTIREAGNISSVFYILNTVVAAGTPGNPGLNDSDTTNSSNFMTFAAGSQAGTNYTYTTNITLNFSGLFTNPGGHSLWFCANDTANNVRCSDTALSYIIKGVNISELKSLFRGVGPYVFSMNITLENFTADEDNFMAPTLQNYTITFNSTANELVNIVGMTINESYMRDASNTQLNRTVTTNVRDAIGNNDYDVNMSFMNVTSFLPGGTLYKYGRFDFLNKNFEFLYRCNGSSSDSPGTCTRINRCNDTVTVDNHSTVIPTNGACFVKNLTSVNGVDTGSTYLFSDTFSGGGGANDSVPPRINFVNPTNGSAITRFPVLFNVNISDLTGVDNRSINVTVNTRWGGNISNLSNYVYHFSTDRGQNTTNTSGITCSPNTNESASIVCNITFDTLPNGTVNITVAARDSSTQRNLNASSITLEVSVYPYVSLHSPRNGTIFNNKSGLANHLLFNYTPFFTQSNLTQCSVWGNFTNATFSLHQVNQTAGLASGTMSNFSLNSTGLLINWTDGSYRWNVKCNDSYGRDGFNTSTNFTFIIDTTNPGVGITVNPTTLNPGETVSITCTGSDNIDRTPSVDLSKITKPDGGLSSDKDGSFSDTSTSGTYTAECTTTDHGGLTTAVSRTFIVNQRSGSTGGGGSGGGGSGGTVRSSAYIFSEVKAGTPIEAKITNAEDIGINGVVVTAKEDLVGVKITVNQLDGPSKHTADAPLDVPVFKYVEISTINLPDEKVASAIVRFNVEKKWLEENGLSQKDVILKKYVLGTPGTWKDLETEKETEDVNRVYYRAEGNGLSFFAISSKPKLAAPTGEAVAEEEVSEEVTPPGEVMVKGEKPSLTWLWVLLALVVVAGAVALAWHFKRKKR